MRVRKQDANGDYTVGSGSDFYVNEPAGVAQSVQTRLLLFSGQYFIDLTQGTPWNTQILGKYTSKAYDAVIKQRILSTAGVSQIRDYSSNIDPRTRALSVSTKISTIYDQTGATSFVVTLPTGELYGADNLGGYGAGGYGGPTGV